MATKTFLLSIGIILLLQSCNSQPNGKVKTNNPTTSNEEVTNDWKKDKVGCLKLRTEQLATTLIKNNQLVNATKERFLKVFGSPNETQDREGKEVLIYYFDTVCVDGKLKQAGDKCYANFYFVGNSLGYQEFICE